MLLAYFAGRVGDKPDPMTTACLLIWLAVTVIVTVLDYIIPVKTTQMTGGHKAASTGALIGLVVGMFMTPVGMIMGSLIGAFWSAFKAGAGAFLGFLLGTGLKLITAGVMAWLVIKYSFL